MPVSAYICVVAACHYVYKVSIMSKKQTKNSYTGIHGIRQSIAGVLVSIYAGGTSISFASADVPETIYILPTIGSKHLQFGTKTTHIYIYTQMAKLLFYKAVPGTINTPIIHTCFSDYYTSHIHSNNQYTIKQWRQKIKTSSLTSELCL